MYISQYDGDGAKEGLIWEKNTNSIEPNSTQKPDTAQNNTDVVIGEDPEATPTPETVTYTYIGNANTKKFHYPTCRTLPKEENRTYFTSRDKALNAGYSSYGNCKP